jgi:hypothetical protein
LCEPQGHDGCDPQILRTVTHKPFTRPAQVGTRDAARPESTSTRPDGRPADDGGAAEFVEMPPNSYPSQLAGRGRGSRELMYGHRIRNLSFRRRRRPQLYRNRGGRLVYEATKKVLAHRLREVAVESRADLHAVTGNGPQKFHAEEVGIYAAQRSFSVDRTTVRRLTEGDPRCLCVTYGVVMLLRRASRYNEDLESPRLL